MPPVTVSAPGTSRRPEVVWDSLSARGASNSTSAAIGTLTKKIQRHET